MKKIIFSAAVALALSFNAFAKPQAELVFEDDGGFFGGAGIVWGFDFVDADNILVTLKDGRMLLYNLPGKTRKELQIPPSDQLGQGGLLDVLYHPPSKNVFWTFSEERGDNAVTSLARGVFNGEAKTLEDVKTIFRAQVIGGGGRHFGSRLLIDGEHIYITIGDRGERDNAQLLTNHNGTILRLTFDGKPAAGNPFADRDDALPEIFSYGHRNPQGIDIHPDSGEIYSNEFGPRGGDELNLIKPGKNYGWPIITYGKEYWGPSIGPARKAGMEQPLTYWTPSISPSGMAFYSGDKIPQWRGDLFIAVLGDKHLRRLRLDGEKVTEQEILFPGERTRQVKNSPDGYLYFSTDSGKIFRVIP